MLQVKSGAVLNLLCILILQLSLNTYAIGLFDLDTYPSWAPSVNATLAAAANATDELSAPLTYNPTVQTMMLNVTM